MTEDTPRQSTDIIVGQVESVFDGPEVMLEVVHQSPGNTGQYRDMERVRLARLEASGEVLPGGNDDRRSLEWLLRDAWILCRVRGRDAEGCVLADARIIRDD